jgi:hypothetical protein
MITRTIQADSVKELKEKYALFADDGFHPGIVQVYASVSMNLQDITSFFAGEGIRVFGCSSCGEFLFNDQDQLITEGAIVCLLMEIPVGTYDIKLFPGAGHSSAELGNHVGKWVSERFEDPALLLLASGLQIDGEQLVKGVQAMAGNDVTMFGGLAGDDAKFRDTFVFSESVIENNGAIVMVFDKAMYDISGLATSGWAGIGAEKIITQSEGNIVYTIDDQPALDVYTSYLNVRKDELPEIGVEYPLLIKKDGEDDVLRAVLNVDLEKKSLIFAGSVPQGSKVTFSSSPGFEIIEMTRKKIIEFSPVLKEADLLILFSCMARHLALGPTISEEIIVAWEQGNAPLIGFFTYGEIGSSYNSTCNFHNETFTLVTIKQKR